MGRRTTVLFLYSELAGYFLACVRALVERYDVDAHIVHWPANPDAPFRTQPDGRLRLYDRSRMGGRDIGALVEAHPPSVVYVVGWMDPAYLRVAGHLRRGGVSVVAGLDTHWGGAMKQRLLSAMAPLTVRKVFSHLWIPGLPQYEYARRLGFPSERILTGLYSADVERFSQARQLSGAGRGDRCRRLLYVGRLVKAKGVLPLYRAFHEVAPNAPERWRLTIAGTGPLGSSLPETEYCERKGFLQPAELPELFANSDAFVLPSLREPWGVVLHEAAAAGLSLLASTACGAATAFLRHGYNGYAYASASPDAIRGALERLLSCSPEELGKMGERSRALSGQITPDSWASTLMSTVGSVG